MEEVVGIHGEAWSCLVQEFQLKMEGLRERREELETKELDLRRSLEKFNTFLTVIKPTVELSSTTRGKKKSVGIRVIPIPIHVHSHSYSRVKFNTFLTVVKPTKLDELQCLG